MPQDYLGSSMNAMDRNYYRQLDTFGTIYHPVGMHEDRAGLKTTLGPMELGQSANPFQNQLLSLQARIRAGASSVELTFSGVGKGNQQQSTPEMYGFEEREALRQLAEFNEVRTSTHASFGVSGLAGFSRDGFSREAQHQTLEEVKKAVDFASQATMGGAVVVHTGEWSRPITEAPWAKKDFNPKDFNGKVPFSGYFEEEKKAFLPVVDSRTGRIISGITKDQVIYEPQWMTAKDYEKQFGQRLNVDSDTLVDIDGAPIDKDNPNQLLRRVPLYDREAGRFKTRQIGWEDLEKRRDEYNKTHDKPLSAEQLYAQVQIDNEILQSGGQARFYGREYAENLDQYRAAKRQKQIFDDLLAIKDEKKRTEIINKLPISEQEKNRLSLSEDQLRRQAFEAEQVLERLSRNLQYVNEASSAADVRAAQLQDNRDRLTTIEEYGLKQSGQALGQLGVYAMEKSKQMRENVKQKHGDLSKYHDIYIAPENVFAQQYGSHPEELIKIIKAGRQSMAEELMNTNRVKSREEAEKIAAKHIKSTIDIGHLNTWKTHMLRKDGESESQFNARFEKWMLGYVDKMHKEGILGHFHLTDNMGFNDEHLTPGQGNAPVKSFVKKLEELGYKDFIIEQSGQNDATIMQETWSYLGAMPFRPNASGQFGNRFTDMHMRHSGGYFPPTYIVGAYAPSNEWTFWSGVPLE